MKIRMSQLKKLIREAVTSLASSQGFRAAGLAAGGPYRREIPVFRDPWALTQRVVDGADYELLFDTLRQMLADDEKSNYLDASLVAYIKRFIGVYEKISGGLTSGDHKITAAATDRILETGIAGLYDAGSPRREALDMFGLVEKLGPEALQQLALAPRSPSFPGA